MSAADVPRKTSRRIAELLSLAADQFDSTTLNDVSKAVLWFSTEVVGSKKFPRTVELHTIRSLCHEFFSGVETEQPEVAARIDDEADFARYQLRYGERTKIARDPGCTIL